jgi:lipopolysaccharide assembly protein A
LKKILWLLRWVLKAVIFFILFAFALSNQQSASLNFGLSLSWQAPQILIVLAVFALGLIVGGLAVMPKWLQARQEASEMRKNLQEILKKNSHSDNASYYEVNNSINQNIPGNSSALNSTSMRKSANAYEFSPSQAPLTAFNHGNAVKRAGLL